MCNGGIITSEPVLAQNKTSPKNETKKEKKVTTLQDLIELDYTKDFGLTQAQI